MKGPFYRLLLFTLILSVLSACSSSKKNSASTSGRQSKSASKLSPGAQLDFERTFYNANKEKMLNNFLEAANLFRKCLQIDPSNAASMYELANLLYLKGDYAGAESLAHSAALIQPKNEWYQDLYANCLTRNNKFSEAIKVREKMVDYYPEKLELLQKLSIAYFFANRYDDAIDVYNKIEALTGVSEELTERKKFIYIKQNKLDKAIVEVQKLINTDPKEVHYYEILADLYDANNMDDKAFETYELIKKMDPSNALVHLLLSNFYGHNKQSDKAYEEMKLAFENPNLDLPLKIKQLIPYYTNAEYNDTIKAQAYELLDIAERVHPKEADIHSIYADFLYREKKYKEAKERYNTAVQLDKSRLSVWSQLLFTESQLNDFSSMQLHSKEAIELFPSEPLVYFFNGISNLQLNNNKEAIASLKKGVDLVVENKTLEGQFYANLGDAYYRDKQMNLSDSAYEKALEINPKDSYVLNNYSYYLSLRNQNLDKAENMSRLANELDPNNGNSQDTYAWILYASAKYVDAKLWIEKAIVNGGDKNPVILEHYGDILFKLNEKSKALEYWIKAKEAGKGSDFLERKINEKTLIE